MPRPLNPGVFKEITMLRSLRLLELVAADAPKSEYPMITNMTELAVLGISHAPNFGVEEATAITNLTRLRSLELDWTRAPAKTTNVFRSLTELTNLSVEGPLP